jgi:tetratricopeptide (TPR) repeat protein
LKVNMGAFYMMMGRVPDAERVCQDAYQTALKSRGPDDLYTGGAAYCLATVTAHQGHRDESIEWVRLALAANPADAHTMLEEPDLQSLKNDPEFERLIADARARDKARQGEAQH